MALPCNGGVLPDARQLLALNDKLAAVDHQCNCTSVDGEDDVGRLDQGAGAIATLKLRLFALSLVMMAAIDLPFPTSRMISLLTAPSSPGRVGPAAASVAEAILA